MTMKTKLPPAKPAMKTKKMNNRRRSLALFALLALVPCATLQVGAVAHAQDRAPARRTVDGTVHDRDDHPLPGAVVYLKDTKSLAIKTFLSDDEGNFHFGQLSPSADYEIHAEYNGVRSKSRSISYFDSKNDFHFTLKLDAARKAS